jgi:hypothetical protein
VPAGAEDVRDLHEVSSSLARRLAAHKLALPQVSFRR